MLKDHVIYDEVVVPGAAHLLRAFLAAEHAGFRSPIVRSVEMQNALVVSRDEAKGSRLELMPLGKDAFKFAITDSYTNGSENAGQVLYVEGLVCEGNEVEPHFLRLEALPVRRVRQTRISAESVYETWREQGLQYGPQFRWVTEAWRDEGGVVTRLRSSSTGEGTYYPFHPGLLDGIFQTAAILGYDTNTHPRDAVMPIAVDEVKLHRKSDGGIWCHAQVDSIDEEFIRASITAIGDDGTLVASVKGLVLKCVSKTAFLNQVRNRTEHCYALRWQKGGKELGGRRLSPLAEPVWLLVGDKGRVSDEFAQKLTLDGQRFFALEEHANIKMDEILTANQRLEIVTFHPLDQTEGSIDQLYRCISLLRQTEQQFAAFERELIIVTRGAQPISNVSSTACWQAPHLGLARVIAREHPDIRCRRIDLDPADDAESSVLKLYRHLVEDPFVEEEVALRGEELLVPRLVPYESRPQEECRRFRIGVKQRGSIEDLEKLNLERIELALHEVEVKVRTVGLNFRDVLNVLDMYPGNPGQPGGDFSGDIIDIGAAVDHLKIGDRVTGFADGCLASHTITDAALVAKIPDDLTYAKGATIPSAYVTAYLALFELTKVTADQSVLVHAATGGVGTAAVKLLRALGATILGTAGNEQKRALLSKWGVQYVSTSRSRSFAQELSAETHGRKVDVVLNSLSGEGFIEASLSLLRKGGHFVEIGKRGIWSSQKMKEFRPDINYHVIALDVLLKENSAHVQRMQNAVLKMICEDQVDCLETTTFNTEDVKDAFRYMAQAKHIGKVIVTNNEVPQAAIDAESAYVISGGLGGLGQHLCDWLVKKGARHLVLLSRSEDLTSHQRAHLEQLRQSDVNVSRFVCDVSKREDVVAAFDNISNRIGGVFHLAGVVDDGMLSEMSVSQFERAIMPKILGAWNLHLTTSRKPLDFFVMYSSVASLFGLLGQGNYAAANAFLDTLAYVRRQDGLPATTINWGPWEGVGMAAKLDDSLKQRLRNQGFGFIEQGKGDHILDKLLEGFAPTAQVAALSARWAKLAIGETHIAALAEKLIERQPERKKNISLLTKTHNSQVLADLDLDEMSKEERLAKVSKLVSDEVVALLGVSQGRVSPDDPLMDMGIDSLLAVELRNRLKQRFQLEQKLPITLVFDFPTVREIGGLILKSMTPAAPARVKQQETQSARSGSREKVERSSKYAIIGMGCRFPGGANDLDAYWAMLNGSLDAISKVPAARWDVRSSEIQESISEAEYIEWGGFLKNVDIADFDVGIFGISPAEAREMDPQQRLALEVTWEALENAGINASTLKKSKTGVFFGVPTLNDYDHLRLKRGVPASAFSAIGTSTSVVPGRLSYIFGLQGPCVATDTACSSTHTALFVAMRSLQAGDCDMAIVGASNVMLVPEWSLAFARAGFMAADGRCKAFDASADGYVRAEGCGVIVLKRLTEAESDQNRVWASVCSVATNQDGQSGSLTAPNGPAQQRVIGEALRQAGLTSEDIDYVEAHGTGTSLGDPIEIGALHSSSSRDDRSKPRLAIGSVKTNVGHLEASSGMAAIIKVALALNHERLPSHLHLSKLNPGIDFDENGTVIAGDAVAWPRQRDRPRRAGISAFAFQGSNAHAILEEAPPRAVRSNDPEAKPLVLVLSAESSYALQKSAKNYMQYCDVSKEPIIDICATAALGRKPMSYRLACVFSNKLELHANLAAFTRGDSSGYAKGHVQQSGRASFIFGSLAFSEEKIERDDPSSGLAKDLAYKAISMCKRLGIDLVHASGGTRRGLAQQSIAHVIEQIHAYETLSGLLEDEPVIVSQGLGGVASAVVSGHASLDDICVVVASWAENLEKFWDGKNFSFIPVSTPEGLDHIKKFAEEYSDFFRVAASITPVECVLAVRSVDWRLHLEAASLQVVGRPQESPLAANHFLPYEERLWSRVCSMLNKAHSDCSWIHVTGLSHGKEVGSQSVSHRFTQVAHFAEIPPLLVEKNIRVGVELDAASQLGPLLRRLQSSEYPIAYRTLRGSERIDQRSLCETAKELFVRGVSVDWEAIYPKGNYSIAWLPSYPFDRKRYWLEELGINALRKDWVYEIAWVQTDSTFEVEDKETTGQFLIFEDKRGVGAKIRSELEGRGHLCWSVLGKQEDRLGRERERTIGGEYLSEITSLLDQVQSVGPLQGIIWCWPIDIGDADSVVGEVIQQKIGDAVVPLLGLFRAITDASSKSDTSIRLYFLTKGAQVAAAPRTQEKVSIIQSTLWGLVRVFGLENPEQWGALIDIESGRNDAFNVRAIANLCLGTRRDNEIAIRSGGTFERRLVQKVVASTEGTFECHANRSYIVTGGLGGIGLEVAGWLVERGARFLLLASRRSAVPSHVETRIEKMRAQGTRVEVCAADVCNPLDIDKVIARMETASFPKIAGIVHAAGLIGQQMTTRMDLDEFAYVTGPKISGSWNLLEVAKATGAEWITLFSSGASVWGSAGQGHYAAGNAFLDALALGNRETDLSIYAFNWGPWARVGMAVGQEADFEERLGLRPLDVNAALKVMETLMTSDTRHAVICDFDWRRFREIYELRGPKPLLSLVGDEAPVGEATAADRAADLHENEFIARLRQGSILIREHLLREHVRMKISNVLGGNISETDADRSFVELGIDSLVAVECRNVLSSSLGIKLPATLVFDYPTVNKVVDVILKKLFAGADSNGSRATAHADAKDGEREDELEDLTNAEDEQMASITDEEAAQLLDEELSDYFSS